MPTRRSLDDTCDIFLSRRRTHHRAATELPSHHAPTLCAENIVIPPCFLLPVPRPSAKPLPQPGSSGVTQQKPTRLLNGRSHVPRPRNPFILFRCDLVHQRKMLPRSDMDDTNISRIAGDLWREMTAAQKRPWIDLAAQEKARHAELYPDYKYAPAFSGSKSKKAKSDDVHLEDRPPRQVSQMGIPSPTDHSRPHRQVDRPRPYPQRPRRSSSCPPVGAAPVPLHPPLEEWSPVLVTRDDMHRRPSITVMYQSVTQPLTNQPDVQPTAPVPDNYNPHVSLQGCEWLSPPHVDPLFIDPTHPVFDLNQNPEPFPASSFNFFDNTSICLSGVGNNPFTALELAELERLTTETNFADPFSTLATIPVENSPYAFPVAMPPFDFSGYSAYSPSSSSSGTFPPTEASGSCMSDQLE